MIAVSKQLNENLARLAWSLWTELGVAGLERNHKDFCTPPEELIILTSALSEFDPRLRDEALDWCLHYHHFISPTRLQILAKKHKDDIAVPFSVFSATINAYTNKRTNWAVLTKTPSLKFKPSNKSNLRNFETQSMIHFRLRSFLGVNAKADVLAFLLENPCENLAISDLLETGYCKRRLATILADFAASGTLSEVSIRNQLRYTFVKRTLCMKFFGGIPSKIIPWQIILEVLLKIRTCLQEVETHPIGVRVIDLRNLLNSLSRQLSQIKLKQPPLQNDCEAYWNEAVSWILDFSSQLSRGTLTNF